MLADGAHYTLPDGTIVQAIQTSNGRTTSWRLDTADGQPAYLLGDSGRWMSLRYDATIDGYAAAPSDLTTDDLVPVF